MSLKLLAIFLSFSIYTTVSYGQLKVYSDGTTNLGTTISTAGYQLRVNGAAGILATSGSSYFRFTSNYYHGIIGSSSDKIYFWTNPSLEFNKVYAQSYSLMSDSSRKTDIIPLNNGLDIIMQLNPVSFNFKPDSINLTATPGFGFVAQEVELIIPQIVDTAMNVKTMSYDQIIPFLVDAVQTQQAQIDSLTDEIDSLNMRMIEQEQCDCKIKKKSAENYETEFETSFMSLSGETLFIELGQNNPNPFKESTVISYVMPETTKSAQIIIYDLQGKELESYQITRFGEGSIIVDGSTFKPGMYVYAMIVDGNYIDSKKMILTK